LRFYYSFQLLPFNQVVSGIIYQKDMFFMYLVNWKYMIHLLQCSTNIIIVVNCTEWYLLYNICLSLSEVPCVSIMTGIWCKFAEYMFDMLLDYLNSAHFWLCQIISCELLMQKSCLERAMTSITIKLNKCSGVCLIIIISN